MVNFIYKALRGGLVSCSRRHVRANNREMKGLYNPEQPSKYIYCVDANNLYGFAMMDLMPEKNFTWVYNVTAEEVLNLLADSKTGYFLELDLDYPEQMHDALNELPFCAEFKNINGTPYLMETLAEKSC